MMPEDPQTMQRMSSQSVGTAEQHDASHKN